VRASDDSLGTPLDTAAQVALAVALGPSLLTALAAFPRGVLGVLLGLGGVEVKFVMTCVQPARPRL
jgi:hypothetical protein